LKEWSKIPGVGDIRVAIINAGSIASLLNQTVTKFSFEEEMVQNLEMLHLRELVAQADAHTATPPRLKRVIRDGRAFFAFRTALGPAVLALIPDGMHGSNVDFSPSKYVPPRHPPLPLPRRVTLILTRLQKLRVDCIGTVLQYYRYRFSVAQGMAQNLGSELDHLILEPRPAPTASSSPAA
jgi:hypothetical protein